MFVNHWRGRDSPHMAAFQMAQSTYLHAVVLKELCLFKSDCFPFYSSFCLRILSS